MLCCPYCSMLSTILFSIVTSRLSAGFRLNNLFSIVDNIEQCGQHNIVQSCFQQPSTTRNFYACSRLCGKAETALSLKPSLNFDILLNFIVKLRVWRQIFTNRVHVLLIESSPCFATCLENGCKIMWALSYKSK